jgi:monoamine oxidase
MSVAVSEPVSEDYAAMMREELALHDADPKEVSWHRETAQEQLDAFHVVIVGAGMSGLLSAIKLQQAGIFFTVIEKNDVVGGTWYENRYPGWVSIPRSTSIPIPLSRATNGRSSIRSATNCTSISRTASTNTTCTAIYALRRRSSRSAITRHRRAGMGRYAARTARKRL